MGTGTSRVFNWQKTGTIQKTQHRTLKHRDQNYGFTQDGQDR